MRGRSRMRRDPGFRCAQSGLHDCVQPSPLAETRATFVKIAAPILGQYAASHIAMKRRIGPVANACDKAMLDRVKMDVVDVSLEIPFIANGVFPEAALPE